MYSVFQSSRTSSWAISERRSEINPIARRSPARIDASRSPKMTPVRERR